VIGKLPLQWCLHPSQICAALWRHGLPFPFSNHSRAKIFGGPLLAVYALGVFSGNKVLEDTLRRREEVAVYDPDLTATQAQDILSKGDDIPGIHSLDKAGWLDLSGSRLAGLSLGARYGHRSTIDRHKSLCSLSNSARHRSRAKFVAVPIRTRETW
jgi:hypothetical protein